MQQVHRYLDFATGLFTDPVDAVKSLIVKHDFQYDPELLQHYRFPLSELPESFVGEFTTNFPKFFIKDWEVFYTPAGENLPIHSDGFQPFLDFVKFNFVYNGGGSVMSWYQLKDGVELEAGTTRVDTSYTAIREDQVNRIHSCAMDRPSLINAGVPHGVDNSANIEGRWCVCLIPCYRNQEAHGTTRILFKDAEKIFEPIIVDSK